MKNCTRFILAKTFLVFAVTFATSGFEAYASNAKTELICVFSHPQMVVVFDPDESTVTYTDEFEAGLVLTHNGSLVPNIPSSRNPDVYKATPGSRYKIIGPTGELILDLTFNYKGFDGSSEMSYPFEVVFYDHRYNDQFGGGCYTENALPIFFDDIISEIQN